MLVMCLFSLGSINYIYNPVWNEKKMMKKNPGTYKIKYDIQLRSY